MHEQHFQRKENESNNIQFESADWSKRRSEISFLQNYTLGKTKEGRSKKGRAKTKVREAAFRDPNSDVKCIGEGNKALKVAVTGEESNKGRIKKP